MKHIITLALLLSAPAFASTPPEAVDQIDLSREGNLSSIALNYYKKNLKVGCDANFQVEKIEIVKIASASSNQEKRPGTPYDYQATYLVLEKCLSGSTFVGAYQDTVKATAVKGSFHSLYNSKGGPKNMEDLKIEKVKEMDLSIPQE